ncbi:LOW QUALITY PROTEIN: protein FAM181B [Pholidichthys leucotaenia]
MQVVGHKQRVNPVVPLPLLFDVLTSFVQPPERSLSFLLVVTSTLECLQELQEQHQDQVFIRRNPPHSFPNDIFGSRITVDATGVAAGLNRVMAVQTAIMNPQFMNFCFPGSVMEYDVEKSLDGSLLGETENDEDYKETTRDLLSFIDSASSNIKLALDKPVKSKRKVNHRKYLQKQIKRCTGIITPENTAEASGKRHASPLTQPSPLQNKTLPKRDGVQANLQSKSLAALFSPVKDIRGEKAKKPPLRHRNLPPSFFTEPAHCSKVSSTSGMTLKDLERGNPEAAEFFELLGPDYSNMVSDQDLYQGMPIRAQPEMAGLDPASYDTHHLVGGLLYSEPWIGCSGPTKKIGENQRTGPAQPPVYCQSEVSSLPIEDNAPCTLAFPNFFTDCSIPQVTYDLNGGYNRANYSSL